MAVRQFAREGREEIAENDGFVGNGRDLPRLDGGGIGDLEMPPEERLRFGLRRLSVEKEMEGVKILVMRVNAVPREAAAEPVGTVVHDGDRLDHAGAAHLLPASVDDARNGASGGVAELSFFQQHS